MKGLPARPLPRRTSAHCGVLGLRYVELMNEVPTTSRDYTLPEGCPTCGADLPVRVTTAGPSGVCKRCGWFGRPFITVTHQGLRIHYGSAQA
jgi:hypothetical protein